MQYESERIEYKSQMIDNIYKEVITFANTDGGVIYLGITVQVLDVFSSCTKTVLYSPLPRQRPMLSKSYCRI